MEQPRYVLDVRFYVSASGVEPVRDWLKGLPKEDRRRIGEEVKTVQLGWPLGMPLVRKLEKGLWEVRVTLENRIARILFTVHESNMILLHGFIKKTRKISVADLEVSKKRMKQVRSG